MPLSQDTSKMSPEELSMLKVYEEMATALTGGALGTSSSLNGSNKTKPDGSDTTTKREEEEEEGGARESATKENNTSRSSDRSKVRKIPADNKRPPSLYHPSAYSQTGSIYTDPRCDHKSIHLAILLLQVI